MANEEWTPLRIGALMAYWTEGLTTSEIGLKLGVTKNAVVGKVHRLGLPKRQSPIRAKPKAAKIHTPVSKPNGLRVRLEVLKPNMCRWPEGEPGTDNLFFCGEGVLEGKPYCAHHAGRAYVQNTRDSRSAQADRQRRIRAA